MFTVKCFSEKTILLHNTFAITIPRYQDICQYFSLLKDEILDYDIVTYKQARTWVSTSDLLFITINIKQSKTQGVNVNLQSSRWCFNSIHFTGHTKASHWSLSKPPDK